MKRRSQILVILSLISVSFVHEQWVEIHSSLPYIQCTATAGTNLFVGTNGKGVFLSTDNGANWIQVNNGLTNHDVRAFAFVGAGAWNHNASPDVKPPKATPGPAPIECRSSPGLPFRHDHEPPLVFDRSRSGSNQAVVDQRPVLW